MIEAGLKLIREINDHGFEAYIVGGFVRDYILGVESNDIDICTSATPMDVKNIFEDNCSTNEDYGSVIVTKWGIKFEITTYREEISYVDNRKPDEIRYVNNLYKDLLRRDFTINSICMNGSGEIIDLLSGRVDLDRKIIRSIGDSYIKFEEDCLRILRAIRFATVLDFELDGEVKMAISNKKHLLKNLSYNRKKEELDKIFSSSNCKKGINLLLELGLDKELELERLKDIIYTDDLVAVWSVLNVSAYPFSSSEKKLFKEINEALNHNNLDPMVLYKYGLYVNSVAGSIKGIDKKKVAEAYNNIKLHTKKDLDVDCDEIVNVLGGKTGSYLGAVYDEIIHAVLYEKINNNKEEILKYVVDRFN